MGEIWVTDPETSDSRRWLLDDQESTRRWHDRMVVDGGVHVLYESGELASLYEGTRYISASLTDGFDFSDPTASSYGSVSKSFYVSGSQNGQPALLKVNAETGFGSIYLLGPDQDGFTESDASAAFVNLESLVVDETANIVYWAGNGGLWQAEMPKRHGVRKTAKVFSTLAVPHVPEETGFLLHKEHFVQRDECIPLLGNIIFEKDGFHRANFGANSTINAFVRIDEVLIRFIGRMNAVDRTDFDARSILRANARLRDDVGHRVKPPPPWGKAQGVLCAGSACTSRSSVTNLQTEPVYKSSSRLHHGQCVPTKSDPNRTRPSGGNANVSTIRFGRN